MAAIKRIENPDGSASFVLGDPVDKNWEWVTVGGKVGDPVRMEPPKLYCPAHGKMEALVGRHFAGKTFCPECIASALERIGVHVLVEKPPAVEKKW